jgi:hypothetical protein
MSGIAFTVATLFAGVNAQTKKFVTGDRNYESTIKSAMILPYSGAKEDFLEPAIIPLGSQTPLRLTFDDLKDEAESYYLKIIHCNADWSVSSLLAIQYMDDYNEFFISDRKVSVNTKIPYVHYSMVIPPVKISGNYVVLVYRDSNEEDIILSRRFMVYQDELIIGANVRQAQKASERTSGQQVDFTISYPDYQIINPATSLKVFIRQNFRWDNSIQNLQPMFVKENQTQLEYNYFNMENGFKGGNEFNAFDISSFITYKLNIGKILTRPDSTEIILVEDKPTAFQPYSTVRDIDGRYYIENYDVGESETSADYAMVNFVLNIKPVNGKVFVIGSFNDWTPDKQYELTFNKDINKYFCRVPLKQGYYNYKYTLINSQFPVGNDTYFSGSYSETQNQYEILAYYRPPGQRSDYLIGYKRINFMERK